MNRNGSFNVTGTVLKPRGDGGSPATGVLSVAHLMTKQDMSRWTRAHAGIHSINWSVTAGPGGSMIVIEHDKPRPVPAKAATAPAAPIRRAGSVRAWAGVA